MDSLRRFVINSGLLIAVALALEACSSAAGPDAIDNAAQEDRTAPMLRLSYVQRLGKQLFFDKSLSDPPDESCATCHAPEVGWTGPKLSINQGGAVYPGANHRRFGNRKPPSAAYAMHSPPLHLQDGDFVGGMFWDGRATGAVLGAPLVEQAMGPLLNPVEQNLPSAKVLCERVEQARYLTLYKYAWGEGPDCYTRRGAELTYERVARAIAAFEASREVSAYNSKYDLYLHGKAHFSHEEMLGLRLFNGKGKCANCHSGPDFTDFTYDNLGVPKNPDNPFYHMDRIYVDGKPINPDGQAWVDLGLGGFLAHSSTPAWQALAAENVGKHKVPTLRNVALSPTPQFVKAYTHNGYFKSLGELVHFYNTRDVPRSGWPPPEVSDNVNHTELGNLGLTAREEAAIVAFLGTLSDE
jgi:cytochrome c peroxidase